ncbi:MAG: dihydrolipoyl dehydrogenase [Firmicutes bacterium]|nr:dihydrolipoyl dehydrogenase [Bacillota bacterium]
MKREFDLIVIGAGPGGYVAAIKAAKAGLNVAVAENRRVGGTCLNRGCIPAKAMIHASSLYREAVCGQRFGLFAEDAAYDYEEILKYKQESVDQLVGGIEQLLEANGVTILEGTGTLLSAQDGLNRVQVSSGADRKTSDIAAEGSQGAGESGAAASDAVYCARNVILAAGSKPARIPVPGMDLPHVLDSDGLFALEDAPQSLIIIGGGVIGVEFATVFSNLGTEVTIIEALPKLLDNFDKEISQNLKMILKKRGVEAHLNASVKECLPADDDWVRVSFEEKGKAQELSAEYVLVAAGRAPVTEGLFGEGVAVLQADEPAAGGSFIRMNRRFVAVDEHFRTSMPGVYAIGDLAGGIMLAHAASAQGARAVEEILAGQGQGDSAAAAPAFAQKIDVIPAGVYTDPEIATVGITEAQAKEQGIEMAAGKFIMSANGKSLITREERGFIKVVADATSHKVLGAQMMCARATDMIAEFATAIVNDLTVEDMLRSIRPHPTYNEGIAEALEDVFGQSLHTVPRRRR